MKNKTLTIILIIFLSLLALIIITFMIMALLHKDFNYSFKNNSKIILDEIYDANINNIKIDAVSSDVFIKEATDEKIHVVIYGKEKEEAKSFIENETLNISKGKRLFCFGFCYEKNDILVYLPKKLKADLDIKTISGEIEIGEFLDIKGILKTTSGDVNIKNLDKTKIATVSGDININSCKDLEVNTTSGEIEANKVVGEINIATISGDINLNLFEAIGNSDIKTTSGDVDINNTKDIYVDASSISGDIDINNNDRYSKYTLKIKTTSGSIKIN